VNYKRYRNEVVNLIRINKRDYYKNYFEEHRSNMKKTWDGIRSIINISKKTSLKVNKLQHQGNLIDNGDGMANAMNSFFVNIGSMVEAKIPNVDKSFSSYLGERKNCELLIGEATMNEKAKSSKNSIPVNPRALSAYQSTY
jgi:hypothetical protein